MRRGPWCGNCCCTRHPDRDIRRGKRPSNPANHVACVILCQCTPYLPARPHGREETPACKGPRGSRPVVGVGERCRVGDVDRRGQPADPLFCDLLANLHLHLEHEVDVERVLDVKRISTAAVMSIADAIEHALPALGRSAALDTLLSAYSLAAPLWQLAHPPKGLTDAYAEETEVPQTGTSTSHRR
jgi:hypothetical protein